DEAEHPYEPARHLDGVRSRVVSTQLARNISPYRREPVSVLVGGDEGLLFLFGCRASVTPGLAQEEDVLDVVLHHSVRQVRLAEVSTGSRGLQHDVGYLEPSDRGQAVEARVPGPNLYVRREWQHVVAATPPAGNTDVPHDAGDPAAGDQH